MERRVRAKVGIWLNECGKESEEKKREEMPATSKKNVVNETTVNDCLCERWSNINEPRKVWNYIEGNNTVWRWRQRQMQSTGKKWENERTKEIEKETYTTLWNTFPV